MNSYDGKEAEEGKFFIYRMNWEIRLSRLRVRF
jgi:hypothetical protein